MSRIDDKRLLSDLQTLRSIGAYRTGVHRPTYSPTISRRGIGSRPG